MTPTNWKALLKERFGGLILNIGIHRTITAKARNCYQHHKKKVVVSLAGLILGIAGTAYAKEYYDSQLVTIYHVSYRGQVVGTVSSPEIVDKWLKDKLQDKQQKAGLSTLIMSDKVAYLPERVYKGQYDNEKTLAALNSRTEISVEAVKVVVDGKTIGYVANEQDGQALLERLKRKYANLESKQAVTASSIKDERINNPEKNVVFKEDIQLQAASVAADEVFSLDKMEEFISKGTLQQVVYTVKEGDVLGSIANRYALSLEELYELNPGITEDTLLQIGQIINVTSSKSFVTVQVTEQITEEESLDYSIVTRNNTNLPRGETKVIQPGKEGKRRVTYQITKENGKVTHRKILTQQVLAAPINQIVERGTKSITSRGTGRMSWPAKGVLTSSYGQRWGKLHKGLDIAGSGAIKATDNGRVIQAGWYGRYGNAVIISHGNGVQTLYGHMKSIQVREGQTVEKGQTLGIMGSTGDSTGVHVHFEVRDSGNIQNPMRYLQK